MKKLFQIIFTLALSMTLFGVPVFAAEAEPTEIPVTVKFVKETAWTEVSVVDNHADLELKDGVQISVSGEELNGLTFVVYPIPRSDEQVWEWFTSCMDGYGNDLYPLELYFVDDMGNRVEVQSAFTVTVTCTWKYQTPAVFYLSENETVDKLDSKAEGTAITFTADNGGYYVLAETEGINTPENPDEDGSVRPSDDATSQPESTSQSGGSSPQTGDERQPLVWCALLLISGGAFLIIVFSRKKQKEK